MPLELTTAASATDKWMFRSGTTTLVISNEEMKDIKSLEKSGLLLIVVSETIKTEAKEQKGGFPGKLLDILGVCLLRNLLTI